jgi:hypothetical protein
MSAFGEPICADERPLMADQRRSPRLCLLLTPCCRRRPAALGHQIFAMAKIVVAPPAQLDLLSENSKRAALGGRVRPIRSSIKPRVRQAPATMGQEMVIQFMAQYRWVISRCLAERVWLRPGRQEPPFYTSEHAREMLQTVVMPPWPVSAPKDRSSELFPGRGRRNLMANRIEQLTPGVRLAKVSAASTCQGFSVGLRIVMSRDENDRGRDTLGREFIPQIDS